MDVPTLKPVPRSGASDSIPMPIAEAQTGVRNANVLECFSSLMEGILKLRLTFVFDFS